jgi:PAS domain S-box-containing protein
MASIYSLQAKQERFPTHALHNQALPQRIGGGYLFQLLLVFVAYMIAGKLGQATTNIRSSNLGPVWPAFGIALAAILICGYRAWIGVAAAAFVVAFFSPVSHLAALGQAAGSTLAAVTGAFLLHRVANFDRSLTRLSDALSLIALGGFGSATLSASSGLLVLYASHVHAYSGLGAAWLIYWLGDATGVLLITPLVLRFRDLLQLAELHRITEVALLLMLLALTCFVIFADLPSIAIKLHIMAFAVLPFIIWAAIRFGLGVTALAILTIAAIATIETALGSGPFASNTTFVNAVLLDVFFAVLSVTGLSLAAVIGEREHAEREREHVVSKQAAMEERLRTADALRESEEKLREYEKAVEGAEDMIGVIDREYRFLLANRQYLKMRNLTREQVVGHFLPEVLNKEVFEAVIKPKLDECFGGKVIRYEMKLSYPTVGERDLLLSYFPIEGRNGIDRVACILHDLTDRKRAEQAVAEMTRRLVDSQENERVRIGRELHDDIAQRLAMLAIDLERLQDNPSEVQSRMQQLRKQAIEISNDVQALSHELHSSKLEYLGLVGGMRSWCKEFGERKRMEINFKSHDLPGSLPQELSTCLFRILQEGLNNAAKHSAAKRVDVQLEGDSNEIHLIVSDSGTGFDTEAVIRGLGLGLISMQERVRLVNGTIAVQSKPMRGTTIHARVPFRSERSSERAAG